MEWKGNGMELHEMIWNGTETSVENQRWVHPNNLVLGLYNYFSEAPNDMEWDEIVCSKSMQDPPKKEPGAFKI